MEHKRLDEMAKPKASPFTLIERAESLVRGYPNPPSIRTTGRAAFYRPSDDSVTVPPPESFESPEAFYSVLFMSWATRLATSPGWPGKVSPMGSH